MTDLPPVPQSLEELRALALDRSQPLELRQFAWSLYRRASRQRRADTPQRLMTKEKR